MGVLTARPRRPASPARRRARGPLLWSLALHGAAFVALARGPARVDAPAEVVFTVSVASAAQDEVPSAVVEADPPPTDAPPEPLPPLEVAPPEPPEPAPEARLPDEPAEAPDEPAEPLATPTTMETRGPRSAATPRRRPVPAAPSAVAATPRPATPAPAPTPVRAVPPSAASAGASAVEGARPDAGNQPPAYPTDARAHRWTGVVTLRLAVDASGAVRGVEVEASSGYPSLDEAAVTAAWGWRFSPARRDGVPFASSVRRRIRFVLDA